MKGTRFTSHTRYLYTYNIWVELLQIICRQKWNTICRPLTLVNTFAPSSDRFYFVFVICTHANIIIKQWKRIWHSAFVKERLLSQLHRCLFFFKKCDFVGMFLGRNRVNNFLCSHYRKGILWILSFLRNGILLKSFALLL